VVVRKLSALLCPTLKQPPPPPPPDLAAVRIKAQGQAPPALHRHGPLADFFCVLGFVSNGQGERAGMPFTTAHRTPALTARLLLLLICLLSFYMVAQVQETQVWKCEQTCSST
jgi:hypothetical protein